MWRAQAISHFVNGVYSSIDSMSMEKKEPYYLSGHKTSECYSHVDDIESETAHLLEVFIVKFLSQGQAWFLVRVR